MTRVPTMAVKATSAVTFTAVSPSAIHSGVSVVAVPNSAGSSTNATTVNRSSTTSQPTAMWPGLRVEIVVVRKDADEHDRAGDGQRHAENQPGRPVPAKRPREQRTQHGGDRALRDGAGDGDAPYGEQFFDVELEARRRT